MRIAELTYSVAGDGIDRLLGQVSNLADTFGEIGQALTEHITKPLVDLGMSVVDTTMTFDQQMSKVSAVTGATGGEFDKLRDSAIKMGSSTDKTATQAAEAIEYMGLAGWSTTDIMAGLPSVLDLSSASNLDLGRTSDLVTDSMAAYGLSVNDLTRYLDVAANAQANSNMTTEQFLEGMIAGGGTAKMFGIELEELAGIYGILANRGFKGAEAGNALTAIMSNMTNKTNASGKAMKELGIEVYDSNGKFRGLSTILGDMNTAFEDLTDKERDFFIQQIGGKTRTKELTALLNGQKEELGDLTKTLYGSDGALSKMASTMRDNLAGQVTQIKSKLEGIAIMIGDKLTPFLRIAATQLQRFADWFYNLSSSMQNGILAFTVLIGIIPPLISIFALIVGGVVGLVAALSSLFLLISTIGLPVFAAIGGATILLSAAFVAIGVAVTGYVTAITTVLLQTGILQWAFESLKTIVLALVAVFKGDLETAFTLLTEKFGMTEEKALAFLTKIDQARSSLIRLGEVVRNVTSLLGAIFTADKQKMVDILVNKFQISKTEARNFADKVLDLKNKIGDMGEKAKSIATHAIALFGNRIKRAADFVYDHRTQIANFIMKLVEMGSKAISIATTVVGAFRKIKNGISSAISTVKGIINGAISVFQSLAGAVRAVVGAISKIAFPSPPSWISKGIPGFAKGVRDFSGGLAWVGEEGAELVGLPKGSNVYSNKESKDIVRNAKPSRLISNSSSNNSESVNLYGDIVIDAQSVKDFTDIIDTLKGVKMSVNMR